MRPNELSRWANCAKRCAPARCRKIEAEHGAEQHDEDFETPVDGRAAPLQSGDASTENACTIERRHEARHDRFRDRAATGTEYRCRRVDGISNDVGKRMRHRHSGRLRLVARIHQRLRTGGSRRYGVIVYACSHRCCDHAEAASQPQAASTVAAKRCGVCEAAKACAAERSMNDDGPTCAICVIAAATATGSDESTERPR